jgi:hypothetical protein
MPLEVVMWYFQTVLLTALEVVMWYFQTVLLTALEVVLHQTILQSVVV